MSLSNYVTGGALGGCLGYGAAWLSKNSARAAYTVRPKLAEVGYIEAMMTDHGGDWLFYNYPTIMTGVTMLFFILVGIGAVALYEH